MAAPFFGAGNTLGATQNKTAATSFTHTTSAAAVAGSLVLVFVAKDNVGAGNTNEVTSVTDSVGGNTWTKATEFSSSLGAAGGGCVAVYYSRLTNGLGISAVITINLSSSVTAKAVSVWNCPIELLSGYSLTLDATAAGTDLLASTSGPVTVSFAANFQTDQLVVIPYAVEGTDATALTQPADGSYGQIFRVVTGTNTGGGGAASNMGVRGYFGISGGVHNTNCGPSIATGGCFNNGAEVYGVVVQYMGNNVAIAFSTAGTRYSKSTDGGRTWAAGAACTGGVTHRPNSYANWGAREGQLISLPTNTTVSVSTDGIAWSTAVALPAGPTGWAWPRWTGKHWIVSATSGGVLMGAKSVDGVSWTSFVPTGTSSTQMLFGGASDRRQIVGVNNDGTSRACVYSNDDGATWSTGATSTTEAGRAPYYNGAQYCTGTRVSTNGVTWTSGAPIVANYLEHFTWNSSQGWTVVRRSISFVTDGISFTSRDGITWLTVPQWSQSFTSQTHALFATESEFWEGGASFTAGVRRATALGTKTSAGNFNASWGATMGSAGPAGDTVSRSFGLNIAPTATAAQIIAPLGFTGNRQTLLNPIEMGNASVVGGPPGGGFGINPDAIISAGAFGTMIVVVQPAVNSQMRLISWRGDGHGAKKVRAPLLPGAATTPMYFFRYTDMPSVSSATSGARIVCALAHGYMDNNANKFKTYNIEEKTATYSWGENADNDVLNSTYAERGINFYQFCLLQNTVTNLYKRIEYTGTGVGGRLLAHGLGRTPVAICADGIWAFAGDTVKTWWLPANDTGATYSTTFTVAPDATNITLAATSRNTNATPYIMHCFTDGGANLCATGTYAGNGATQSVALGMKPRMVIIFRTDVAADGVVFDQLRSTSTDPDMLVAIALGRANTSAISGGVRRSAQILSTATGFDILNTSPLLNTSGGTYRWLAFRYVDADVCCPNIPSAEVFGRPALVGGARAADQTWVSNSADDAWKDEAYYLQYNAEGATGPYSYAVTSGALATGLSLSSDGLLTGTTTANGTFTFDITVTPTSGGSVVKSQSIIVADMPVMWQTLQINTDDQATLTIPNNVDLTTGGRVVVTTASKTIILISADGTTWYNKNTDAVSPGPGDAVSASTFGNGTMTLACTSVYASHLPSNNTGFVMYVSIVRNHPKAFKAIRYVGDNTSNRVFAHGLETTPVHLSLYDASYAGAETASHGEQDYEGWNWWPALGPYGVIATTERRLPEYQFGANGPDATNITIGGGNAANCNYSGHVWYLCAIAGGNPAEHRSLVASSFVPLNNTVEAPTTVNQKHFDSPVFPRWFAAGWLLNLQSSDGSPDSADYTSPTGIFGTNTITYAPSYTRVGNLRLGSYSALSRSFANSASYGGGAAASGTYISRVGGVCPVRTSTFATESRDTFYIAFRSTAVGETGQGITFTAGIASAEIFGAPAVENVILRPSAIASEEAFGTAALQGGQTVTATEITSGEAFGAVLITLYLLPDSIAGEEALGTPLLTSMVQVSSIASAEAFGSHALTGAQTISATGIASDEAFGTAQVLQDGQALLAESIGSDEAFGAATVSPQQFIDASSVDDGGQQFGATTVRDTQTIGPTGIASGQQFGATTVRDTQTVMASSVAGGEVFGAPRFRLRLLPSAIASSGVLGDCTIFVGVGAYSIAPEEAFGRPRVTVYVTASSIAGAEALGMFSVSVPIYPSGIVTAQALGSPALSQRLYVDSAIVSEAVGTPRLSYVLAPSAIASGEGIGAAVVTGRQMVFPTGITSAEATGTPVVSVGGVAVLAVSVASAEAVGTPALVQGLRASALDSAETFGEPTVGRGLWQIAPTGFDSSALGSPIIVVGGVVVSLVGVAGEEAVGEHIVAHSFAQQIVVVGLPSGEVCGYPLVSGGCETTIIVVVRSESVSTVNVGEC